ncbi:lytic transglycosylase domain-containing protein [Nonomuraea sp. NBC_01738]|nr:lytic transglycosylase domain-containing protein [Nonomuraea sp. NBC_01738]
MIFGLTAVVVVGGGAFVAKRSYDNSKIVPTPITPEDFGKIALGDLYAPDPKADAYKAAAVTAYKKDKLKNARKGVAALDWIEIKDKGPGGDGFPQANFPPGSNPSPGSNKGVAKTMLSSFGFGAEQWGCLEKLWMKESGWNERAMNRYSGAYGIPQSLPGSKMASAGSDWQTNAATQIKWGLGYIKGRYGTPCGAWGHSQAKGWY